MGSLRSLVEAVHELAELDDLGFCVCKHVAEGGDHLSRSGVRVRCVRPV
jgi:hypothetical protein